MKIVLRLILMHRQWILDRDTPLIKKPHMADVVLGSGCYSNNFDRFLDI